MTASSDHLQQMVAASNKSGLVPGGGLGEHVMMAASTLGGANLMGPPHVLGGTIGDGNESSTSSGSGGIKDEPNASSPSGALKRHANQHQQSVVSGPFLVILWLLKIEMWVKNC